MSEKCGAGASIGDNGLLECPLEFGHAGPHTVTVAREYTRNGIPREGKYVQYQWNFDDRIHCETCDALTEYSPCDGCMNMGMTHVCNADCKK